MNKMTLVGISLVAAIPAAVLTVLMVLVFLQHTDKASGVMLALVGVTMLSAAAVALMPVGIFLFGGPPKKAKSAEAEQSGDAVESSTIPEDVSDEFLNTGEFEASGEIEASSEFEVSREIDVTAEIGESDEFAATGEFDMSDELEVSEEFDLTDDEFDSKDALK